MERGDGWRTRQHERDRFVTALLQWFPTATWRRAEGLVVSAKPLRLTEERYLGECGRLTCLESGDSPCVRVSCSALNLAGRYCDGEKARGER